MIRFFGVRAAQAQIDGASGSAEDDDDLPVQEGESLDFKNLFTPAAAKRDRRRRAELERRKVRRKTRGGVK